MNIPKILLRILLGQRLPTTSGKIIVSGISNPISICRDRFGIPYIKAENDWDTFYGLGFCQGQDRGFQVHMIRHAVRGTLSELIGEPGLPMDRLSRRIGFFRSAQDTLDLIDPDLLRLFESFIKGFNDGMTYGCAKPPHEFSLLRFSPTQLEMVDILAAMNYTAFSLSTWTGKLSRLLLFREHGPEVLKALDTNYASWMPVTKPVGALAGPAMNRLLEDLTRLTEWYSLGGASNNWAVNASRSAYGRPILANDPHLAPSLPAPWYLAHASTPEWRIAGATFMGSPIFASGHNQHAAWGVTAGLADNIDLYIEELSEDGNLVRDIEGFVPTKILTEVYNVKGGEAFEEQIIITPRGPIISDVLEGNLGAVSMRAVWMEPKPIKGFMLLHNVRNFDDFRAALSLWPSASLNMVYADVNDTIGWQMIGDVPKRLETRNQIPMPGWNPGTHWESENIPFEHLPYLSNPTTGYIATANNKPEIDGVGPYLGDDWVDGYRLARIGEVLSNRSDWDLAGMAELQLDQLSLPWREMRESVLAVQVDRPEGKLAKDLLESWDGIVSADSPEAAVYQYFITEMAHKIVSNIAPDAIEYGMGKGFHPMIPRAFFGISWLSKLSDQIQHKPEGVLRGSWDDEIADALMRAVMKLKEGFGSTPKSWAWGQTRPLTLLHPFGNRPPMDKIFNLGPFPWGGDTQTVSQAGRMLTDLTANPPAIANLRMAVDVGNWENNYFVLAGGQSGNPLSPHYADMLELWKRGEGIPIAWSQESIQRISVSDLRLIDQGSNP